MILPLPAALALATALASSTPIPLEGGRATFTIGPEQFRRHVIALEAGQFVQATVHQLDIDVVLRLLGPDGVVLEERFDSSEGPVGREPASLQASVAGLYTVEVFAPADVAGPGRYELESQPPRQPDARDRRRREAERLMEVGGRFMGPRAGGRRRNRPSNVQCDQARRAYDEVLPLWEALGETWWEAEARTCLALLQTWLNDEQSIDNFVRALDLWQAAGDDDYKFIEAVLYAGRAMDRWSRLRDAAQTMEFGLLLARDRDEVLTSHFLIQLAGVYGQLGDSTRAIERGEEGLAIVRALEHKPRTAVVLTNLARAHYRRGSLQKANDLAVEALALRREIGEELGLMTTLATLAEISLGLGEPDLALSYVDETIRIGTPFGTVQALLPTMAVANVLRGLGKPAEARARLLRAIEVTSPSSDPRSQMLAQLALAGLCLDDHDAAAAGPLVDRVLAMEGTVGDPFVRAEALDLRARLSLASNDLPLAEEASARSLAIRQVVGDRVGEATSLFRSAQIARASRDLERALVRLQEARAIVAVQRTDLLIPQLRATWAGTVREVEEAYVSVLTALDARDPERGFDVLAFEASEAASARSLLDALADQREPAPGSAADRELAARENLIDALERQMRSRAASAPAAERQALEREVRDLSAEHDRFWAEARASDSARRESPVPLGLADIQSRVLDDETTLLEFFLGAERGYAWAVTREGLHAYALPSRARVDAAVEALKAALAQPPGPPRGRDRTSAALRALAELVLPRERSVLRGTRLLIVADGSLHYVPFAALPDASGRPLIERFEIASLPSASVAAQLRRELAARPPAPRAIAVLADPVYDSADPRLHGVHGTTLADRTLQEATRDFGFKDGRLPRLPFTRREALSLAALAPASSTVRLDFAANVDAALSSELGSYRYVHFATHGLLNDVRPELSGLVLSLVDREGRPRRGLLTAPAVSNLRLQAELVVLSSCRSAAGREVKGEGLVGLTRAFMRAGAPRVVASLWRVDDLATSALMTRMYGGLLGPRALTPAAALRVAQLELLRHRRWRAPYYWAAFQLQGEWR
jgi:CHAT domain-containing protein/tetratricopeptide (TPR) repeat protein